VRLFHESLLTGRGGRFSRGGQQDVARLRYSYDLRADSPLVTLTVTLTPLAGVTLDRPRITTACDAMSPGDGVEYGTLLLGEAQGPSPAGENVTVHQGPIATYGARQGRTPSRAHAVTLTPHGPAELLTVKASGPSEGRLHWLLTRYAAARIAPGEALVQREDRLVLRGTWSAIAGPRGADAAQAASCPRIAAALATQLLFGDPKRAGALMAAVRRHLAALPEAETMPGELAHALMASEMLFRLTRDAADRARGDALAARLLATQAADGVFREPGGPRAAVADHAAAMLALARRLATGEAKAEQEALRRGIAALALITLPGPIDTITLPAAPAADTEGLALLLRALRAAQAARGAGALALPEADARRLAFLADLALRFLQARIRPQGDALIVDGSVSAQVAALAALVPPEGAMPRVAA
jgi:hypothetical protein